ncbi:MAG: hypothetical protein ACXADY_13160 [Candidatus Hodarchaeales archaeon]|jgi:exosortase/archaeosortase family protein
MKLSYQNIESIFLYEVIVFMGAILVLLTRFTPDWVTLAQTIFFTYIIAHFLLKDSYRLIIPPLTSIIILFCVFRIDQMIMNTPYVKILTELTTQCLVLLLKYGNLLTFLILIGSFCVFQSLGKNKSENVTKRLPFVTFVLLFVGLIIFNGFSQDKVTSIDATTIQIESLTRISIVDSCSGIYSLIIFLSSFFFFASLTRINRAFKHVQMILFGIMGIIGIYLVNLLRILILINLSMNFPAFVLNEAHIYLGGIFIISYLSIFWVVIWTILPVRSST